MRIDETRRAAKLGAADAGGEAPGDGERNELIGPIDRAVGRLPHLVQGWLPRNVPSLLLLLAYAWTAFVGLLLVYVSIIDWQKYPGGIAFGLPVLVVGLLGLWRGRSLRILVPASAIWLGLAVVSVLADQSGTALLLSASFGFCLGIAIWFAVIRRNALRRQGDQLEKTTNQLGWNLYRLSTKPPATDDSVAGVTAYSGLRLGEVDRHFDEVTSGAIQGGMQHTFRMEGRSTEIHGLPQGVLLYDTAAWMRMSGSGTSTVQLGMEGRTSADLTDTAFMAVFETTPAGAIDTIRAVVPSARQSRAYVSQLLTVWASQHAPGTPQETIVRRYADAITQAVTTDSSYVADRLGAILRMPARERPLMTIIGEQLNDHAVLAGAIRFSDVGPLYQLFPIALVRALTALIEGRPLPQPPGGLPPASHSAPDSDIELAQPAAAVAAANGHLARFAVRTLGGLRILADGSDRASALLDRKVLAFLWLHLLARKLRNPHDTVTRASLADELSPGLNSSTQRARLRGRLSEMRNELPAGLGQLIKVSGERITLDLTNCDVDAAEVLEAAETYAGTNGVLSSEQLEAIEAVIAKAKGAFLPEWDDIEQHVNSGRGAAGEVIADLRRRLEAASATLFRVQGNGYLSHGKAESAVVVLERALELVPDDEAVARLLLTACLQTGRLARAEALRKDFALV